MPSTPTRLAAISLAILACSLPTLRAQTIPAVIAAPELHTAPIPDDLPTWTPPPHESLPLARSSRTPNAAAPQDNAASPTSLTSSPLLRTLGSLVLVVALIFALRWIFTRSARFTGGLRAQLGAGGRAPAGILQILARYPIARSQTLVLLKLDQRILLLNQTTTGFRTLSEIHDPDEVASILRACRDEEGASLSNRFNALLRSLEKDPATADTNDLRTTAQPAPLIQREQEHTHHFSQIHQLPHHETHESSAHIDPADHAADELHRRLISLRGYAQ